VRERNVGYAENLVAELEEVAFCELELVFEARALNKVDQRVKALLDDLVIVGGHADRELFEDLDQLVDHVVALARGVLLPYVVLHLLVVVLDKELEKAEQILEAERRARVVILEIVVEDLENELVSLCVLLRVELHLDYLLQAREKDLGLCIGAQPRVDIVLNVGLSVAEHRRQQP
jgi:hypothetical protein